MGKFTGIDIGSDSIKMVVGKVSQKCTVEKVVIKRTFPGSFNDGVFIDKESVLDLIFLAFIKKEIDKKGLIFSMSGPFYSKIIEVEKRHRKDSPDWLEWELSMYFPEYEKFEFRYSIIDKDKKKMKLLVTAKPENLVKEWRSTVSRLRVKNASFIPEEIALFNLIRYNYPEIETPVMLLNVGHSKTSVILIEKDKLLFSGKILSGIGKREEDYRTQLADILDRVREIISLLPSNITPTRVYLAGGVGIKSEVEQFTTEYISLHSYVINPFRKVELKEGVEPADSSLYAVSTGLLISKLKIWR